MVENTTVGGLGELMKNATTVDQRRIIGIPILWGRTTTTIRSVIDPKILRPEIPNISKPTPPPVIIPGNATVFANGTDFGNETVIRPDGGVCAPFPPCNPIGCGDPSLAPIQCEECNAAATGASIFGMCLLAIIIVVANLLVIRVILQTPSLRRRHGYIKLSMATSDLLVGLFVIPSAIGNLVSTLYYPHGSDDVEELLQVNSVTSVVFGTIGVISVTSSLYNLMLLSVDRLMAIARPLKHRAGRFFPKKSLWISISLVWIFAISLATIPAFFPAYFAYQMDVSTFFYIQILTGNPEAEGRFSPYYVTVIIGAPYFATVLMVLATAFYTCKRLQVRKRISFRGNTTRSAIERKCERNKRVKMLQEAYPEAVMDESSSKGKGIFKKGTPRHEAKESESEKHSWLSWWRSDDSGAKTSCYSVNNNNSTESGSSQANSQSPRYHRTRDQIQIVRDILNPPTAKEQKKKLYAKHKTHVRVFRMLIAMVVAFSICLLPYVIVTLMFSDKTLECDNAAVPYSFALYMLFLNSGMNFVIYNLWHPEFRLHLIKLLKKDYAKTTNMRKAAGNLFTTTHRGSDTCTTYTTRNASEDTSGL